MWIFDSSGSKFVSQVAKKIARKKISIAVLLVSCGQTAFFSLSLGREKRGSGLVRIPQSSLRVTWLCQKYAIFLVP